MNLLSVENITKNFGDKLLFTITSFGIEQGEKIGVIGVNGTGKSTLLKILVGVEQPDTGTIVVGNNVKIGYLPQEPAFNEDATVIEQVFNGNSPMIQVLKEYENTVEALKFNPASREDQKKLAVLSQQLDNIGAWQFENDAKTILTKLGISNFQRKVGSLSGGQRKRVALAGALINPVDLLVLDEPTNHIDSQAIVWLEEFLNKRKGALLMVTHDRYFLDRVTNRIIEIDNRKLYQYKGNYSCFLELKAERQEQMYASEKKRQNMLRRELAWLKRGAKARTTKQQARIERIEELKEMKNNIRPAKINISVEIGRAHV